MRSLLLVLALSSVARADKWTVKDTVMQSAVTTTLVMDYAQTREALEHGARELNPIMGPHGNRLAPELYFPAVALLHAGVAYVLPARYRTVWQAVAIGVQINTIRGNYATIGFGALW